MAEEERKSAYKIIEDATLEAARVLFSDEEQRRAGFTVGYTPLPARAGMILNHLESILRGTRFQPFMIAYAERQALEEARSDEGTPIITPSEPHGR